VTVDPDLDEAELADLLAVLPPAPAAWLTRAHAIGGVVDEPPAPPERSADAVESDRVADR
jgi:hypothetical protein